MSKRLLLIILSAGLLNACAEAELASHVVKTLPGKKPDAGLFKVGKPYRVLGQYYTPREQYDLVETGIASWYGPNFHGKPTANGEIFDQNELTAAHRTLQIPSLVRVTNLENGRSLIVRVNDRGPFKRGRIIDLSKRAAELLDFKHKGTAKVKLQVLPEESMQVAKLARQGKSTAGTEVALNNGHSLPLPETEKKTSPALTYASSTPEKQPITQPYKTAALQTVEREPLGPAPVKGHLTRGNFYPDPVVEKVAVSPSQIYVQAGSFSQRDNAMKFVQSMRRIGKANIFEALVNGQKFYRVRLMAENVRQADELLTRLINTGLNDALIVVE